MKGIKGISNDDNFIFNLSKRFLENIDLYHRKNFAQDLRNYLRIGEFIKLHAEITNDAFLNLKQYHEI